MLHEIEQELSTARLRMEIEDLIRISIYPACWITPVVVHPQSGDSKMGCGELALSPGYQSPFPRPRFKGDVGLRLTAG